MFAAIEETLKDCNWLFLVIKNAFAYKMST